MSIEINGRKSNTNRMRSVSDWYRNNDNDNNSSCGFESLAVQAICQSRPGVHRLWLIVDGCQRIARQQSRDRTGQYDNPDDIKVNFTLNGQRQNLLLLLLLLSLALICARGRGRRVK